jgi:hypothetical protein
VPLVTDICENFAPEVSRISFQESSNEGRVENNLALGIDLRREHLAHPPPRLPHRMSHLQDYKLEKDTRLEYQLTLLLLRPILTIESFVDPRVPVLGDDVEGLRAKQQKHRMVNRIRRRHPLLSGPATLRMRLLAASRTRQRVALKDYSIQRGHSRRHLRVCRSCALHRRVSDAIIK